MTIQVPTRMDRSEVARIDELIAEGVGTTRSEIVRTALGEFYDRHRRARIAAEIVASYTEQPQTVEDHEWAQDSLNEWFGSDDAPR